MEYLLNQKVREIELSGIRRFFNMVQDEKDVISLTIGQPDFHTPNFVKEGANHALIENKTTYTANAGILELRKAISNFYDTKYDVSFNPENEIIVTTGASQGIDIVFRTILSPGDEVILPGPIYPGYGPLIRLAGANIVHADTTKTDFKLTKETLLSHLTDQTKCVVLPYPSNPTGASFTREEMEDLVSVLKGKDIFILADEIYSELVFEHKHVSIAALPDMKNKTIVINGLSKSHSMTGFRIGYVLAPNWLTNQMLKVHQYSVSCASSISQYAALEALNKKSQETEIMRKEYGNRRDYVLERLIKMGLEVNKPEGAFYFFPKFPIEKMSSFELGLDLVKKEKVALVPGSSFSHLGEKYMRLSYAYDMETISEGLDRLESYLMKGYIK